MYLLQTVVLHVGCVFRASLYANIDGVKTTLLAIIVY